MVKTRSQGAFRPGLQLAALLFALALVAAGCGGGSDTSGNSRSSTGDSGSGTAKVKSLDIPSGPEGVIRVNIATEPFSIDPSLSTDIAGAKVIRHLMEGLVRLDGEATPMPAMAESWEPNDEYTEWTFHLRKDAKWSNGDPVTAHDFDFAIRRILDPKTGSQYASYVYNFIRNGKEYYDAKGELPPGQEPDVDLGFEVVDDHTIVYKLGAPTSFFPSTLGHSSFFPLHEPTIQEHGKNWIRQPATYTSNGPFIMEEYRPEDRLVAVKNPDYWDAENIKLDEIVFRMIEEESTAHAAFLSGDLDITDDVPLPEVQNLRGTPEFQALPYLGSYYIAFNVTEPPFDDLALRKAVQLGINRELIVNQITKRGEKPGVGLVPHGTFPRNDGTDFREIAGDLVPLDYAANVKEAQRILKEAGYGTSKPMPTLTYLYNTADDHKLISEAMQAMWKAIGLDVRLENVEFGVKQARGHNQDFEFVRAGWIGDFTDPMTFLELFETGAGNNDPGYSSEKYDNLLDQIRQETDPVKRTELMVEAERLIVEKDVIMAPIFEYAEPFMVHQEIKGWWRNQLGDLDLSRASRTKANAK